MQLMRLAVTINRPIHDVFDYVTDIPREAEWFTGLHRIRSLSIVDRGVGAEYESLLWLFGWRTTVVMRVTEYVRPARMTLLSTRSAIQFSATYSFVPARRGRGTRIVLEAHVIGGSVYRLLGPAFLPMLRHAVARRFGTLKQVMEGQLT